METQFHLKFHITLTGQEQKNLKKIGTLNVTDIMDILQNETLKAEVYQRYRYLLHSACFKTDINVKAS